MNTAHPNPYDEVPYGDHYFPFTHPTQLCTLARLFGIDATDVESCRVLELGCASGGNLVPMALELPRAKFLGIDLSVRQVADGQALIERLGLRNLELRVLSLTDVDESFGHFDFILCHGVFSWVPTSVRDKILDICAKHLSPNGVAYISYNTYPGWHGRGIIRDLLGYHVNRSNVTQGQPLEQVVEARSFLDRLTQVVPDQDSSFARILRTENRVLKQAPIPYVFHEHLEENNQPLYFHEFMRLAQAKGLGFLAEARSGSMIDNLPPEARQALEDWASDPISREQYLDFLCNRTFRYTLLTHGNLKRLDEPDASLLGQLWFSTNLTPTSPNPVVETDSPEEFEWVDVGGKLATNNPLIKAALVVLFEHAPQALAFEAIWEEVHKRLDRGSESPTNAPDAPAILKQALLRCYLSSLIQAHSRPLGSITEIQECPLTSPLARIQAETADQVLNVRGRVVKLDPFERLTLRTLDGQHDRPAILKALKSFVDRGDFTIYQDETPLTDAALIEQILQSALEPCLERFSRQSLLLNPDAGRD